MGGAEGGEAGGVEGLEGWGGECDVGEFCGVCGGDDVEAGVEAGGVGGGGRGLMMGGRCWVRRRVHCMVSRRNGGRASELGSWFDLLWRRRRSYLEMSIRRDSCWHQDFVKVSVVKR